MDDTEYPEAEIFAATNSVQDLIALARTHSEITDRKMKEILLNAAQLTLAHLAIESRTPFNTSLTQQ